MHTGVATAELLLEEADESFIVDCQLTKDRTVLLLSCQSRECSEVAVGNIGLYCECTPHWLSDGCFVGAMYERINTVHCSASTQCSERINTVQ